MHFMAFLSSHFPGIIFLNLQKTQYQNQILRPWSLSSRYLSLMIHAIEAYRYCTREVILDNEKHKIQLVVSKDKEGGGENPEKCIHGNLEKGL